MHNTLQVNLHTIHNMPQGYKVTIGGEAEVVRILLTIIIIIERV